MNEQDYALQQWEVCRKEDVEEGGRDDHADRYESREPLAVVCDRLWVVQYHAVLDEIAGMANVSVSMPKG